MEFDAQMLDHTHGVLKFRAGQVAVALHYVDVLPENEFPEGHAFTSMERDLLAYQFQVDPPVRSSSHSASRLLIRLPQTYRYHTEGETKEARRRPEPIAVRVRLCCSEFKASGISVWHVVIVPDEDGDAWLDEFDIIAFIHLYDGRAESTRFRDAVEFVRREAGKVEEVLTAAELLRSLRDQYEIEQETRPRMGVHRSEFPVREKTEFVAGTIQIDPPAGDDCLQDLLAKVYAAHPARHEGTAGNGRPLAELEAMYKCWRSSAAPRDEPWQKLAAFAGIVIGIFDFEAVDVEELVDTIAPTFTDGRIFIQINRCTLVAVTPDDRLLTVKVVRDHIGISPYLLLPHAAILHNETLVRIAEAGLNGIRTRIRTDWGGLRMVERLGRIVGRRPVAHDAVPEDARQRRRSLSLQELERILERASRNLGEHQLPNIFNYVTERTLFEKAADVRGSRNKHKAVDAKRLDIKDRIELLWKLRAERGQIWLAAIASGLSVIPLRTVFEDVFDFDKKASMLWAVLVSFCLSLLVLFVRNIGLRKQQRF
jgi:hypothetical protein